AFTAPGPPVASIIRTSGWRIRYLLSSMVGSSTHTNTPSGAPCFTAASYMAFTAATEHRHAFGWGAKITAFRVLTAMMHLHIAVHVGFVMGVTANMTPTGSATSLIPRSAYSAMVPTVRRSRM